MNIHLRKFSNYLCNMINEEQQKKDERYMRMALDEAQAAFAACMRKTSDRCLACPDRS